jgi:sugar lactone lactonase YvrE
VTGEQTLVVAAGTFGFPSDVEVEPDSGILVSDSFDDQIYRVDPATGNITPLTAGGINATGIAVSPLGEIFVTHDTSVGGGDQILQVDPVTGDTTVIAEAGFLTSPDDIVVESNGNLLVLDSMTTTGSIIRVDRDTGSQTVVASGGGARNATSMALEPTGTVVVASAFDDAVVRINPNNGNQVMLTAPGALAAPDGVAVDADASIVVVDSFQSAVARVDPVTGDLTPITSDGFVALPTDVAIFRSGIPTYECDGFAAPGNIGPITVTQDGTLLLRAALLDDGGQPVTGAGLASKPAIQVSYEGRPASGTPTDVTDALLAPLPFFQGNEFIYRAGPAQWLHGQQTAELSARGVYTLSMVSGDRAEYLIAPPCRVAFVRN